MIIQRPKFGPMKSLMDRLGIGRAPGPFQAGSAPTSVHAPDTGSFWMWADGVSEILWANNVDGILLENP